MSHWQRLTLTTAAPVADIAFDGYGSIYAEGTFGGGTVGLYLIARDNTNGSRIVSTGYVDEAIDGVTIKSIGCPPGHYRVSLDGSTGATVDVFYNDQILKSD